MRYNKYCKIEDCHRWMREDDQVCRHHYRMLPPAKRKLLWGSDADVILALTIIDELERAA